MERRKPLNRKSLRFHLGEAREELERLERLAGEGTLAEAQLQIGLLHAYHHLNFAWNTRRIASSEQARLTREKFEEWGMYPGAGVEEI